MISEAVLVWIGVAAVAVVALLLIVTYAVVRAILREVSRARHAVLEIEEHTKPLTSVYPLVLGVRTAHAIRSIPTRSDHPKVSSVG